MRTTSDGAALAPMTMRRAWARVHPSVLPVAVGLAAGGVVALVATVSPYEAGHYPTCPSLYVTGLYCPGCGSLRAVHDLAHLDLAGAWAMNPLMVLAVPYMLWSWARWMARTLGVSERRWLAPPWVIYGLLAVILGYWVARNIPALQPFVGPG